MSGIEVKIKRISGQFGDIPLPEYATEGSAGMDVRAALDSDLQINPQEIALVPTNLVLEIPQGFEIQVRPRSGLAVKNSIGILNSPGTIDSDYRGELRIILMNFGKEVFTVRRGDRIAQLILSKVYKADLNITDSLEQSKRGEGGFGHTGRE